MYTYFCLFKNSTMVNTKRVDFAIIGGGVAGLWLNSLLTNKGFSSMILEKVALGAGQTLASQGMIHGGLKYALDGSPNKTLETIQDMPSRWNKCLSGNDPIDLRGVKILSDRYYMFSDNSFSSKLTAFLGSKVLSGTISSLKPENGPKIFRAREFKGKLYALKDIVIDPKSLIEKLLTNSSGQIIKGDPKLIHKEGYISRVEIDNGDKIKAEKYILAAGIGNEELIKQLQIPVKMQSRPLHQVVIKGNHLPDLFAHAISLRGGAKPRITFTTHYEKGNKYWYLGGELAESGVKRTQKEQIQFCLSELAHIMPWIDFSECEFSTFRVNRAEAKLEKYGKPDGPFVGFYENVVVCWPTKLTLVPVLGDMVINSINHQTIGGGLSQNIPKPRIGETPWI